MKLSVSVSILCVLLVVLLSETAYAKPANNLQYLNRLKRQSDQRMAELETLFALEKVKGYAVPVGFGKVDPAVVGRKRRSGVEETSSLWRLMFPESEPAAGFRALSPAIQVD